MFILSFGTGSRSVTGICETAAAEFLPGTMQEREGEKYDGTNIDSFRGYFPPLILP